MERKQTATQSQKLMVFCFVNVSLRTGNTVYGIDTFISGGHC